jgi:adenylate cyclase
MKCSECEIELPNGSKFCNECGMNPRVAASASEHPSESIRTHLIPEPERKNVTALFSDLNVYMAMTERLDPEQVKEITGRIFTGVKQIVTNYEGYIERFA